mgnify:CR=1 FL=1
MNEKLLALVDIARRHRLETSETSKYWKDVCDHSVLEPNIDEEYLTDILLKCILLGAGKDHADYKLASEIASELAENFTPIPCRDNPIVWIVKNRETNSLRVFETKEKAEACAASLNSKFLLIHDYEVE